MALTVDTGMLYFSENPLTFDPPLVTKDTVVYGPIRELTDYFDGTMRQSNKTYWRTITIHNTVLTMKAYDRDYTVNGTSHVFDAPPFLHKTRLYVPMQAVLTHLGYRWIKKGAHYYASPNNTGDSGVSPSDKGGSETGVTPAAPSSVAVSPVVSSGVSHAFQYTTAPRSRTGRRLHGVTFRKDGSIDVAKDARISMGSGDSLPSPPRVYWDFKSTQCPDSVPTQGHAAIKRWAFGQWDGHCRMVIHLNGPHRVSVTSVDETTDRLRFISLSQGGVKGTHIVIDPGHGGSDPGAVTTNDDYEKNYTLDISNRIKQHLKKKGATVTLLRNRDTHQSLSQRVRRINRIQPDFFVSVHVNSFIHAHAKGTETYYYKSSEKRAAQRIQARMVSRLKLRNNGVKRARMYVLRHTNVPGVLIEPCFMTNQQEYARLKTPGFRNQIALAVVEGIEDYFQSDP